MKQYIGVDFHSQHSYVAVMDDKGRIIDERRLYHTDMNGFSEYFSSFDRGTSVALEATRNWYWLVDCLQDLGLEVKLVHAKKARIIAESTIKTDKIDARVLAHLDRCDFLPQAFIADKETRSQRELLRYYMSLVKIRTSVKNRVHAVLAKNNVHHGFSDLFGKAGTEFLKKVELSAVFRMEIDGYIELMEKLKDLISRAQKEIRAKCKESECVRRLMTIPGISYFSALLLASEIADIKRFRSYKKLCAYAGLVSTTHQSADRRYYGHIIKDSNKYIRYALIEAVPIAVRKDPGLWSFYTNLQRKKGIGKAKIAVAKKLLITIYYMLRNGTEYRMGVTKGFSRVNPCAKLGA